MRDPRLAKMAEVLVGYSTAVKPGDFVFVFCQDVATPWMVEVTEAAVRAGAHVETLIESAEVMEVILKAASTDRLREPHYLLEEMFRRADVSLSAWGGRNTRSKSNIDPAKIKAHTQGDSGWRKIFSNRAGDGSLRWCGCQFPTESDAQEASMSLREYEDFVYTACRLDKEDPVAEWKQISKEQEKWIEYLDTKSKFHVLSRDTDIRFSTQGRKWINCDGECNFPDGELFTTPVESGIDGHISFQFPGIYMEREIEGIRLEVKEGKVVKAEAEKGEDLLHTVLSTDAGSSRFGEFAIGTNKGIKRFTRNMLFDEKIAGTIHMALGDADKETLGRNESSIHWDLLCDMKVDGKIFADGELFYENGEFLEEVLS